MLIVDDERLNINILNDILKDDYRIKVATNGAQALVRAATHPRPDIILLDIVMPGLDGFHICELLQADPNTVDIPIIFITASSSETDEVRGLALGGRDFISKPVRPEIVRARVKSQIIQLMQKKELKRMHQQLLELSNTDGLTNISNRRRFDDFLLQEWSRSIRSATPLGLVMLDIDHFKLYNDHYGHAVGDRALKQVAGTLAQQIRRPPDIVARYGGEEFVCVLPDTDLEGVDTVCNSLLNAINELAIPHQTSPIADTITVSIGATSTTPQQGDGAEALISRADTLLYESKVAGRNRLTVQKMCA